MKGNQAMTQTAQHTPGPWQAITTATRFTVNDKDGFPVLRINGGMVPVEANARLIAAAPDMLDALEFVRMTFADIEASKRKGYYVECPKIVDAAIAKAEGRTATTKGELPPDPDNMNNDRAEWAAAALRHFQCIT
ncbi:MAG: hypothetical protein JO249_24110, partial [Acidobacteria bacterium]|nr:hypothetical protein [Acidobacteriota bacterium]